VSFLPLCLSGDLHFVASRQSPWIRQISPRPRMHLNIYTKLTWLFLLTSLPGMSCADSLSNHPDKFDVTVIEAQNYCGGQAFSIPIDEKKYGAPWMNQGVQGCASLFFCFSRLSYNIELIFLISLDLFVSPTPLSVTGRNGILRYDNSHLPLYSGSYIYHHTFRFFEKYADVPAQQYVFLPSLHSFSFLAFLLHVIWSLTCVLLSQVWICKSLSAKMIR
jgi:hypothetical protein